MLDIMDYHVAKRNLGADDVKVFPLARDNLTIAIRFKARVNLQLQSFLSLDGPEKLGETIAKWLGDELDAIEADETRRSTHC